MNLLETFFINNETLIEEALRDIRIKKYQKKIITKKNGEPRELSIPPSSVKAIQANFNKKLQDLYKPTKSVHAFIKSDTNIKRNIVSNASIHINKYFVINVDIEKFLTA